jgi:hypothetical protein
MRRERRASVVRAGEDDMDWTIVSFGLAAFSGVLLVLLWRAQNASRPDDAKDGQLEARIDGMFNLLAAGQSKLADSVNARLDSVSTRLGESLDKNKQATTETLV